MQKWRNGGRIKTTRMAQDGLNRLVDISSIKIISGVICLVTAYPHDRQRRADPNHYVVSRGYHRMSLSDRVCLHADVIVEPRAR